MSFEQKLDVCFVLSNVTIPTEFSTRWLSNTAKQCSCVFNKKTFHSKATARFPKRTNLNRSGVGLETGVVPLCAVVADTGMPGLGSPQVNKFKTGLQWSHASPSRTFSGGGGILVWTLVNPNLKSFISGEGVSGLQFQRGALWSIWTQIYFASQIVSHRLRMWRLITPQ